MFVKVSFKCGKQKRVLLAVKKKKKTNNMQHKQKENKRF